MSFFSFYIIFQSAIDRDAKDSSFLCSRNITGSPGKHEDDPATQKPGRERGTTKTSIVVNPCSTSNNSKHSRASRDPVSRTIPTRR